MMKEAAFRSNKQVESEWAKLSASMMNLSRGESRRDLRETNLSSSKLSLDLRGERTEEVAQRELQAPLAAPVR